MQTDLLEDSKNQKILSVSEYTEYVNHIVSLDPVIVEGEVSNFRDIPGRGFCYFDIKDEKATARCFQGFWHSAKVDLSNGAMVKIFGYPALQKNGTFVIDVREVLLAGEGALKQAYLELKAKLEKEGLFDSEYKKRLPVFPRSVGLIAGKNSSAYHDVVAELSERWGGAHIFFHASKVQGIHAKGEIISAIKYFNQKQPIDVLIVARGGGSMEDLQAFDSEEVVREIFASKISIISAIGHEDHWTLSDFVSDVRAKTPTKAAQIAVPDRKEIAERLEYFTQRSKSLAAYQASEMKTKLENFENVLRSSIRHVFQGKADLFDDLLYRAEQRMIQIVQDRENKLSNFESMLKLLNPHNILRRGYGIVEKNGKRVKSIAKLDVGDEVMTTLHDGAFKGKIVNIVE